MYINVISRSAFIFLFVYTASAKFIEFTAFKSVLSQSPLIGSMAPIVAWILPVVELGAAGLLVFRRTEKAGTYLSMGLMIIFSSYIFYMLLFVPHLPCSCGGVIRTMSWSQHLVFNVFFIGLAVLNILTAYQTLPIRGNEPNTFRF
jgi:hypothetical protein